jgi:outer membrane immunogenic protein
MRRQILLASVGAIAIAGSAFAADLPYRGPPPVYLPPPPIFTWSGLYVGGQIGYAWGTHRVDVDDPTGTIFDSVSSSPNGVIGGAHIGYNLQIGQWVAGLEGTVDGTSASGNAFVPNNGITVTTRSTVQGSIRARAGIAFDRVLIYATGGVAFADITNLYNDTTGFTTTIPGTSESISQTRAGWTVGGGLEYALTNNWSVRAEYRYSDFGHFANFPFTGFPPAGPLSVSGHLTENQVQAGFSYKFTSNAPAPVVAKY